MSIIVSFSATEQVKKHLDEYKKENPSKASNLINNLLADYFSVNAKSGELLKEKAEENKRQIEILQKQVESIEEQRGELIDQEVQEKIKAERLIQKEKDKEENIKSLFKEELKRDLTEEELAEYLLKFNSGQTNFFEYLKELKKKDKKKK